ncbi:PREDICTED: uncharacterized protein LOC109217990 [Nicotiana attenuata]|uniref:uncharacterized protein LOC109217990 n=1 Tax=Nicotiana attenuata TaxID=49451 RepID=UPI000905BF1C|nr:PREDICTED: uncharacterized protein LOC109217990 [Nicotiana attenuata]
MLSNMNYTTVTLVPKVNSPTSVKEFRPIACCSTIYKLTAKILTAKLKTVVDYIVGPAQLAFIKGRNILDNVIIAHELVKGYTQKGVSPRCLIKVDIKAYDSVEWPFLKMILLEFGMPVKFVQLVMECVTTVSYSPLINGGLTTKFQAKNGLRQGDSLPICIGDGIPESITEDTREHSRLQLPPEVSGLKANMEKSALYIAGVPRDFKEGVIADMQFTVGELPFKYLGVTLSSKKLSIQQCMPLIEKTIARLKCWSTKFLSYSGRVKLIKSVIFEITFFWTGSNEPSRRALVAWDKICMPLLAGGLNVIDVTNWNKAALCKLLWEYGATLLKWLGERHQIASWNAEIECWQHLRVSLISSGMCKCIAFPLLQRNSCSDFTAVGRSLCCFFDSE